MNKLFSYEWSRKTVNGQDMPEEGDVPSPLRSPDALTRNLSKVNSFDYAALEINSSERLSFGQILNAVQVIVICSFVLVAAIWLFVNVPAVFNSDKFINSALACGNSILGAVGLFGLGAWGLKIGFQRYLPDNFLGFLQRLLLGIDLLIGHVEVYEGAVSKDEEMSTRQRTDYTSSIHKTETVRNSSYFYRTEREKFRVSQDAFSAFPSEPINCRLYYLPLSRVMVNLEVL